MAGAGTGSTPCSVFTVPLPTFNGEQTIVSTPSRSKPHAGAHDVGDRIHRADFVEMYLLDRHLVHRGLGLAQPSEYGGWHSRFTRSGSAALVDHLQDVRQVPVRVLRSAVARGTWSRAMPRRFVFSNAKRGAGAERIQRLA